MKTAKKWGTESSFFFFVPIAGMKTSMLLVSALQLPLCLKLWQHPFSKYCREAVMERVVINISIILTLCTCVDILSNAKKKITKYWFDLFTCLCRIHRCSLTHHIRFLRPSQLLEIHIYKIYILLQCCWIATARTGTALLMVYKRFHGDVFPHAICPDEKKLVWTLLQRQLWSFSLLVCIYLHIWHKYFQNHRVNSKLFEHIIQNTSLHIDLPT